MGVANQSQTPPQSQLKKTSVKAAYCFTLWDLWIHRERLKHLCPTCKVNILCSYNKGFAKKQNKTKPSSESSGLWARFLISPVLLLKTPARGESPQPVVTLAILKLATSYYFIFVTSSAGLRLDWIYKFRNYFSWALSGSK